MRLAAFWPRTIGFVLLAASAAVTGAAASVAVSSDTVAAATVTVPRCTNAGLSVLQNLSAGTVVSVTVGGLPAACGGATLQASVNNGTLSGSGSAAVPVGGGSVIVTLGIAPAVATADQIDIVVVGP